MKQVYTLTEEDNRILEMSRVDGRYFGDYYLRKKGQDKGWVFDYNIDEPWQLGMHHAHQKTIVAICGVGTGKTLGCGVSAVTWACTANDFRFLNVAPRAWQARQMYEDLLTIMRGTLLEEQFLWKSLKKPFPTLLFRHSGIGESKMEFMSVERDADNLQTWGGDWINIDQAEQMNDLGGIIAGAATRLRGVVNGRERLGRLSMLANSSPNPDLWYYYHMAKEDPEEGLAVNIHTSSNRNITKRQLFEMMKKIPPRDRERLLAGMEPDIPGREFSSEVVDLCEDDSLAHIMDRNEGRPGYVIESAERCGVIRWELPPDNNRIYIIVCDPGQGNPPHRNAPVVAVLDITDYPAGPIVERAFWWGFGEGSYDPFVTAFMGLNTRYNCVHAIYDSTGGQKAFAEFPFREMPNLIPMDLSGGRKASFHVSLKILMQKGLLKFSPQIRGRRNQLLSYVLPEPRKLAQDIVATYQLLGGYLWFYLGLSEDGEEEDGGGGVLYDRHARPRVDRHLRTGRA